MKNITLTLRLWSIKYAPWFAVVACVLSIAVLTGSVATWHYEKRITKIENTRRNVYNKQRREIVRALGDISSKLDVLSGQIGTRSSLAKQSVQEVKKALEEAKP